MTVPLDIPEPPRSAKVFLDNAVPKLLDALGIERQQKFLGFKVDVELEARKRIAAMNENDARAAVYAIKKVFLEW